MNKKVKGNYERLAQSIGLWFDDQSGMLYGYRNQFGVIVYAANENAPYALTVEVSAGRAGGALTKEEKKRFSKENKPVVALNQKGQVLAMTLKAIGNQEKLRDRLDESLNALMNFLRANGYQNCCQSCGKPGETDAVVAGNVYMELCPECFTRLQQTQALDQGKKQRKKENILGGIIGALIGSLLGVLCIVILGQLGYVAALSGLVMAVCTMKGYELLGGKLSAKGIVISVILMILMTYVGNQLDWAIAIAREVGVDVITAFQAVPLLVSEGMLDGVPYWGNLVMVYIFALLGAVPTVRNIVKDQKHENVFYRPGSSAGYMDQL